MFTVPDLPYAFNALEPFIDEQTMRIHHDKHHAAYVKNLNDVLLGKDDWGGKSAEEIVSKIDDVPVDIRMKVRNNAGGHVNHSMFWTIMKPGSSGNPVGTIATAINTTFGSFQQFVEKFNASAIGRFGSGWAWLAVSGNKIEILDTPNQDSPLSVGKIPILGIDVWEHAYYLKYQNMRADYIREWWHVVNWEEVERRFHEAG